jgi:hypothetical protein
MFRLARMRLAHLTGEPIECARCGVVVTGLECLRRHQEHLAQTPEEARCFTPAPPLLPCASCGMSFRSAARAERHTHVSAERGMCDVCGLAVGGTECLTRHRIKSPQCAAFRCVVCGSMHASAAALAAHQADFGCVLAGPLSPCATCGKFLSRWSMARHSVRRNPCRGLLEASPSGVPPSPEPSLSLAGASASPADASASLAGASASSDSSAGEAFFAEEWSPRTAWVAVSEWPWSSGAVAESAPVVDWG